MTASRSLIGLAFAILATAAGAQPVFFGDPAMPRARLKLRGELPHLFDEAGREFGVPADLLRAYAFVHTHWAVTQHAGDPSSGHMPPIYGVMGLHDGREGWFQDQVGRAAELLGVTEEEVKEDTRTNVRAAAALLRSEADPLGISGPDAEAWAPVIEQMSAIPLGDAVDRFARKSEVYDMLLTLLRGYDGDGIRILARRVHLEAAFSADDLERQRAPVIDTRALAAEGADDPGALWNPTTCFSSRNGTAVTHVTIHTMQGYYGGTISWFKNCNNFVSAHYLLRSSDGQITQMVHEADMAWHVAASNPYTVGMEHEGFIEDASWYTTAMYNASAALTRRVCERHNIDRTKTYGGTFQGPLSDADYKVKGHVHYANQTHIDPGPLWDWARYRQLVIGAPERDADVLDGESNVPLALRSGESAAVMVRVRNTGTRTWTAGEAFRLGSSAGNTVTWNNAACGGYMNNPADGRVFLCQAVPPGGVHDFRFDVTAPTAASAVLGVRMVQDGVAWFGDSHGWAIASCASTVPTDHWKGEYWANPSLSGAPAWVRDDGTSVLAFDWGAGGPGSCGVPVDHFSARWTRTVNLAAGTYRFTVRSDDGVRVFLDGALFLDKWILQAPTTYVFDARLTAGPHVLRMEFYENEGGALAALSWQAVVGPCRAAVGPRRWKGEYWSNPNLSGAPALVRDDGVGRLVFDWGPQSPSASCGLPADGFSVRWTRAVDFPAGTRRFTVTSDDGFRLYVDGVLRLDKWFDQSPTTYTVDVTLAAGRHTVRLDYYEKAGGAVVKLAWGP